MTVWDRGCPPRHLHRAQDDLFCVLEGEFVRKLAEGNAMGQQDPAFRPPYGMELVGPPLAVE